jgi:hypothetical protein
MSPPAEPGVYLNEIIKDLKIELTQTTKNLPLPLFAKEGKFLPL